MQEPSKHIIIYFCSGRQILDKTINLAQKTYIFKTLRNWIWPKVSFAHAISTIEVRRSCSRKGIITREV